MTDKLMQDTRELLYELIKYSTDHREEWEKSRQELRKQIANTNKQLGDLSRKMGTMIEDFVAPDLPRILRQLANLPDDELIVVNTRVKRRLSNGKRQIIEFDAVADGGTHILVNETKNTLRSEDISHFVETLGDARTYFPEFANRPIIGVVSSFNIDPNIVTHASRQGLVVLALGDGLMSVQNKPDFQWKQF
ncbi:hypothetical protein QUF64_12835 [Anaerolineales bacterium HSG6]|nr:hypothetical protein [Anaerolineales bacterium HSG6]